MPHVDQTATFGLNSLKPLVGDEKIGEQRIFKGMHKIHPPSKQDFQHARPIVAGHNGNQINKSAAFRLTRHFWTKKFLYPSFEVTKKKIQKLPLSVWPLRNTQTVALFVFYYVLLCSTVYPVK